MAPSLLLNFEPLITLITLITLIVLGVDSSWTTHGENRGTEVDFICVICGSDVDCVR